MENRSSELNEAEAGQRKLTWVELLYALIGIAVLYLGLGFITAWVASWWEYERVLLYINGFMTQGMFFLIILFIMRTRKWSWNDFGWHDVKERYLGRVVALYILTWIVNIIYAAYLFERGFTPPDTDVYSKLLGNATLITFCLNLILAGMLAPILEETMFRGIIYKSLNSYMGKWTAAAISAAIFSGLHLQSYGFIPRFVLGMVLASLVMKYNSIKPAVALHALNNIVALLLVVLSEGF
ncbi:MAG: lysostaphin resistance A-like protein [Desulfitobacterium sp.]